MNYKTHQTLFLLVLFASLLVSGCSAGSQDKPEQAEVAVSRIQLDSLEVIMDFESSSFSSPVSILTLEDGNLVISDLRSNQIGITTPDGRIIRRFGRQGRGPGEFLDPRNIQITGDYINVVDTDQYLVSRFNTEGLFIGSYPYQTSALNREIVLIGDSVFFTGTNSSSEHLIRYVDQKAGTSFGFGIRKETGDTEVVDIEAGRSAMQKGEIPDFFKNSMLLQYSDQHLYTFMSSYSEVRKYTEDGELIWDKKVALPYNEKLFEYSVNLSKQMASGVPGLSYITSFGVIEDHVYLLTYKLEDDPQLLIRLNADGEIDIIYTLPKGLPLLNDFTLNHTNDQFYFTSASSGEVFKTQI